MFREGLGQYEAWMSAFRRIQELQSNGIVPEEIGDIDVVKKVPQLETQNGGIPQRLQLEDTAAVSHTSAQNKLTGDVVEGEIVEAERHPFSVKRQAERFSYATPHW